MLSLRNASGIKFTLRKGLNNTSKDIKIMKQINKLNGINFQEISSRSLEQFRSSARFFATTPENHTPGSDNSKHKREEEKEIPSKESPPAPKSAPHIRERNPKKRRLLLTILGLILVGVAASGAKIIYEEATGYWVDDGKERKRIVILGSGWGAMSVVEEIDTTKYEVIVVSPRNYFLFTPLLPSTTVGTIDTRSIVEPVRAFCKRFGAKSARYYEAEATDVDFKNKKITCKDVSDIKSLNDTFTLDYDYLIVSVGSVNNTFGTKGVRENCNFLKEVEDSTKIRTKIGDVFETASLPGITKEEKKDMLSFLVVGGGPTGVEFAAELYDFLHTDVARWYSELIPYVSIKLIHSPDHLLNTYDSKISTYTEDKFKLDKIDVFTNTRVTEVRPGEVDVIFKNEGNRKDTLKYAMCVWSTGIAPSPFTITLAQKLSDQQVHSKLLITDSHLRVKGAQDVFAIGDCSTVSQPKLIDTFVSLFKQADTDEDGGLTLDELRKLINAIAPDYPQLAAYGKKVDDMFKEHDVDCDQKLSEEEFRTLLNRADMKLKSYPATAQVASQQGKWLGKALNHHDTKTELADMKFKPFSYNHLGSFAYVGGNSAVADLQGYGAFEGFVTWWLWRGVYWSKQISLRNKTMVAFNWMETLIWGRDISRF